MLYWQQVKTKPGQEPVVSNESSMMQLKNLPTEKTCGAFNTHSFL